MIDIFCFQQFQRNRLGIHPHIFAYLQWRSTRIQGHKGCLTDKTQQHNLYNQQHSDRNMYRTYDGKYEDQWSNPSLPRKQLLSWSPKSSW
jgi:hypothetical protein